MEQLYVVKPSKTVPRQAVHREKSAKDDGFVRGAIDPSGYFAIRRSEVEDFIDDRKACGEVYDFDSAMMFCINAFYTCSATGNA